MGVNDQITNRPSLIVYDEILNVAKLAVQGLDMMTAYAVSAAQMGIPPFHARCGNPVLSMVPRFTVPHKIRKGTPTVEAAPIDRIIIMPIVSLFKLVGNRLVSVQGWTIFDLFFGQINGDILFFFIQCDQRIRRDQNLPIREPGSGFCAQIANGRLPVIEVEFLNLPDFSVEAV